MDQITKAAIGIRAEIIAAFPQMRAFLARAGGAGAAAADVFLTADWFEHLARHGFEGGVQPYLLGVSDTREPSTFVLPLAADARGLRSLSNYYSSLYGPVGQVGTGAAAWQAVARVLRRHAQGGVLDLNPLAHDAGWVDALEQALRASGYWVDRYLCFGNWYLPVQAGGFDAYFATLPSALRHSIERGRRRLQRTGAHTLTIHTALGSALDEAIADFEAVYQRSWKTVEPCPQFMPGLMRMAALQGWLRLGVLRLQGEPVAAQVWLVQGGKANIYKLAYVQGAERFSPGSVLTAALMTHVMDVDQVREVDYLTGDDAYKRDWMSKRRERIGLLAFHASRWHGLAGAARHFGGRWWRRMQGAPIR